MNPDQDPAGRVCVLPAPRWYDNVAFTVQECNDLWKEWAVLPEFQALFDHVNEEVTDESDPFSYSPTFYAQRLKPGFAKTPKNMQRKIQRLSAAIGYLERCVAYCATCLRLSPKPKGTFLNDANALLVLARSTGEQAESRYKADRSRGGRRRHAPTHLLKPKIVELLRARMPDGGWSDVPCATKAILPCVRDYIRANGIPMNPEGESLKRRVCGWIRGLPEATQFFRLPSDIGPRHKQSRGGNARHAAMSNGRPDFLLASVWAGGNANGDRIG